MSPLAMRLRHMALGWCSVGLVYGICGALQGVGTVVPETALDRAIPFSTSGIWLYVSFFALIPLAYLRADMSRLPWLERAMQMSALVSGAVFLLWPTTLHYPPLADASLPEGGVVPASGAAGPFAPGSWSRMPLPSCVAGARSRMSIGFSP